MRSFQVGLLTVLLALGTVAAAQESPKEAQKSIAEVDALRLEKAELAAQALQAQIGQLQERLERVKEQAVGYLREIQRRDGVEGWQLDLAGRRWLKPEQKPEGK